ncbi:hypothetical protein Fmac_006668 [Flemingia macrophylla]|uniref:Uncharacterized protein n=1 Tax=Flemingia macrophylla TaxID=520843 RepID=A0ABD1NBS1_9FABA
MQAHDFLRATNESLPYEHCRNTWLAPHLKQFIFNLLSIRHLIKLMNSGVCAKRTYQRYHGVAQATCALAKYHHRLLSYHACDRVHAIEKVEIDSETQCNIYIYRERDRER